MHLAAGFDPDPLFFEECWTHGVSTATLNLERRRVQHLRTLPIPPPPDPFFETMTAERRAPEARTPSAWSPHDWRPADRLAQRALPPGWMPRNWSPREDSRTESAHQESPNPAAPHTDGSITLARARQLLGVTPADTPAQIRSAYRRRCAQWHPDLLDLTTEPERRQANEHMATLNQAYALLRALTLPAAA